jgi:hypothetical protein
VTALMKLVRQMRPAGTRHFYKAVVAESGERVARALMAEEVNRSVERPVPTPSAGGDRSFCGCDDPAASGSVSA